MPCAIPTSTPSRNGKNASDTIAAPIRPPREARCLLVYRLPGRFFYARPSPRPARTACRIRRAARSTAGRTYLVYALYTAISAERPPSVLLAGARSDRHPVLYVMHRVREPLLDEPASKSRSSLLLFPRAGALSRTFRPLYLAARGLEVLARADDIPAATAER